MTRPSFPHLPAEGWELYLEGELSGASLDSIESHLEGCADCRRALELADPSFLFRRLRDVPLQDGVLDGLWDEVRAEIADRPRRERARERFALFAGAATLLLAVFTFQALPTREAPSRLADAEACARFELTQDECRDLFVEARFDEEPVLRVEASADLAELL